MKTAAKFVASDGLRPRHLRSRRLLATASAAAVLATAAAIVTTSPPLVHAEEPLSTAEAVKHSVLAHPAFWLIPERQGCIATTTHGPGTLPLSAPVPWDTHVWLCTFTKEFGVARCQNLSRVDVKTRKSASFTELAFTVRPDRSPVWAATFGGLTEAFVSEHERLITNARREFLLQADTFKTAPAASSVHTTCSGRWDPLTPQELADLNRNAKPAGTAKGTPSSSAAR